MNTSQQIFKGGVAQILVAASTLGLSSILITKLGKEQFAIFSMFFFVVSVFLNFDNLPRTLSVTFSRSEYEKETLSQIVASARFVAAIFGFAVGLFCAVTIWITLGSSIGQSVWWGVPLVALLYIIIQTNNSIDSAWLISQGKPGDFQLIRASSFFLAQMCFTALVFLESSYLGAFFAVLIGPTLGKLYMHRCVPSIISSISMFGKSDLYVKKIRSDVAGGAVLGAAVIFAALADKVLIARLPLEQVANYMLPTELVSRMCVLHSIIGYAIFAKFITCNSVLHRISDKFAVKLLRLTILLFCLIGAVLWIGADKIFHTWIGSENAGAEMVSVFRIYLFVFILNGFGWIGFNILSSQGRNVVVAMFYCVISIIIFLVSAYVGGNLRPETMALIVVGARAVDIVLFLFGIRSVGLLELGFLSLSKREIVFLLIGLSGVVLEYTIFYLNLCDDLTGFMLVVTVLLVILYFFYVELKIGSVNGCAK